MISKNLVILIFYILAVTSLLWARSNKEESLGKASSSVTTDILFLTSWGLMMKYNIIPWVDSL